MSRKRILYLITTSDYGGAENGIRELCLRFRDCDDLEPLVCSMCRPGKMAEELAAADIPILSLGMSYRVKLWELVTGVRQLARLIDEHEIDLIHACLYRANILVGMSARWSRRRPRAVSAQHSLTPTGNDRKVALLARLTRGLSDRVIAVSRPVEEILQREGVAPERVILLENGIDTAFFRSFDRAAARRKFDLDDGALVAGGVGRLTPVKGFELLLESLARLKAEDRRIVLLLAGDGPEREKLEQQARSLGIEDQVRFLGMRRDMGEIYAALDIFVLSSLREASPNALLEAMAGGCAIVATRVGGVSDMVGDEAALLVESGSSEALTTALRQVAADADLRRRLTEKAWERVRERYDISQMVERHRQLYHRLMAL